LVGMNDQFLGFGSVKLKVVLGGPVLNGKDLRGDSVVIGGGYNQICVVRVFNNVVGGQRGLRSEPLMTKREGPTTEPWNTLELIGAGWEVCAPNLVE